MHKIRKYEPSILMQIQKLVLFEIQDKILLVKSKKACGIFLTVFMRFTYDYNSV